MTAPEHREVDQLTDAELSRWIAEKLEPFATLPEISGTFTANSGYSAKQVGRQSPLEYHWQPRDMVNDPAMTVLLMSRPEFADVCLDEGVYHALFCASPVHTIDCCPASGATSGKLGRAVAEAFALANGWTHDD